MHYPGAGLDSDASLVLASASRQLRCGVMQMVREAARTRRAGPAPAVWDTASVRVRPEHFSCRPPRRSRPATAALVGRVRVGVASPSRAEAARMRELSMAKVNEELALLQGLRYAGGKRVVPSSFGAPLPDQAPEVPTDTVRVPVRPATARLPQRPRDAGMGPRSGRGGQGVRSVRRRPHSSYGGPPCVPPSPPRSGTGVASVPTQMEDVAVKSPRPWGEWSRAIRPSALESAGGEIRVKEAFDKTWREALEEPLASSGNAS